MWSHPATQRNVTTLLADGRVSFVGPVHGEVASGDVGQGRMAEPEAIASAILARLARRSDLAGRRVLVTAGPTVEDIDPARYVSNRSSGKMGFAIATRAAERGAVVTLVSGPVALATPACVHRVDVRSARDMRAAMWTALGDDLSSVDALVMTAAVADYRPASVSEAKLKRDGDNRSLELVPNPDLLAEVGQKRGAAGPLLVGFALETVGGEALVDMARGKLAQKAVDMVVANRAVDAFDKDDNHATLVTANDHSDLGTMSKLQLADRILDRMRQLWTSREG
jgi:phosphopantothenoylcysteine decarboxylase/phosphopantothenate--cysteine ligase